MARIRFAAVVAAVSVACAHPSTAAAQKQPGTPTPGRPAVVAQPPLSPPVAQPGGDLPGSPRIQLVKVVDGLIDPVNVASARDGSGRLFVVERPGRIRIVKNGRLLEQPFLDIRDKVLTAFLEQGLYSVAFHPDFARNGYFYVHFAELLRNGDSMIVRYQVSKDDPDRADPKSAKALLQIDQPFANHNGGEIAFGPDGFLYIAMGDGGWEGDPLEAGQNINTLLGKLLRIDVNAPGEAAYAIPDGNPFKRDVQLVQLFGLQEPFFAELHTQARPEILDWGLRNPYEMSFDRRTGDLYLPDVGQNTWEEINFRPAGASGTNWGWDFMQASHCFPATEQTCPQVGTLPVAEYSHELGCAVIGMGVYRGTQFPALQGIYFNSDFCSGRVWGLARKRDGTWAYEELLNSTLRATGAGEGEDGELYLTSCNCGYGQQETRPGALWRLVAADKVPPGAQTAPLDDTPDAPHQHGER